MAEPENLEVVVEGDILIMKVNLRRELGLSKSGRNIIIATSSGNLHVKGKEGVMIGLNVYKYGNRRTPYFNRKKKVGRIKMRKLK